MIAKYQATTTLPAPDSKAVDIQAVLERPESLIRIVLRHEGHTMVVTLTKEGADEFARDILRASCAAKAMDMR